MNAPEKLIDNPRLGSIVPEYDIEKWRELIFEDNRAINRIDDDGINVLTVVLGRQNLMDAFDPEAR